MRILILTDHYPPHYLGGYELNCRKDVDELTRRGHDVCVLTSRWGVEKPAVEGNVNRLLGLDPNWLASWTQRPASGLRKRGFQLKWALTCRQNYRIAYETGAIFRPDIAYVWQMGHVSVTPVLAAQDFGIPTVFRVEDYWLSSLRYKLCLEPSLLRRLGQLAINGLTRFDRIDLSHVLMVSQSLTEAYVRLGFREQDLTFIPEGIPASLLLTDDEVAMPPKESGRDVRLAFVGRLHPNKGPGVAIEAMAKLGELGEPHRYQLDIIGHGHSDFLNDLIHMAVVLGLEDKVCFIGKMAQTELLDRYQQYNALLFTSQWAEPFGMTILEAMARGLPVIATNRGAAPEIICDGQNGLLVPAGDPAALADAIRTLVQDPILCAKIRIEALKTVREIYTNERTLDQVEEYFQLVLQRAGSGLSTSRRPRADQPRIAHREVR